MFCPNCGTQNPDTAVTCGKCGFNLKGAAAPKFKGTMLMNNMPDMTAPTGPRPAAGAPGAPPGAPGAPGTAPPSMGQGPTPSKLKGTMV
ncbi:MAG: zinc ribbon domain-containing protein, partial [Polyangiaceae bacterium]